QAQVASGGTDVTHAQDAIASDLAFDREVPVADSGGAELTPGRTIHGQRVGSNGCRASRRRIGHGAVDVSRSGDKGGLGDDAQEVIQWHAIVSQRTATADHRPAVPAQVVIKAKARLREE